MKKLPRTDVIEKQVVATLEESRPGQEITAGDLEAVQGGIALRPMYGVPRPLPFKPDGDKPFWPFPRPNGIKPFGPYITKPWKA